MSTETVFIIIFAIFLGMLISAGFISKKWVRESSDFVIAGREISTFINTVGVCAIGFAGTTIALAPGFTVNYGFWGGMIWGGIYAILGLALFAILYSKFIRRSGAQTLPEYLEMRFDGKTRSVVAITSVLGMCGILANNVVSAVQNVAADKPDGYKIMAKDLEEYFRKVKYTLKEGDIVLLETGASKKWGTKEYLLSGAGMSAEATHWIIDHGVKVVGTDAWSWDVPLAIEADEFERDRDPSIIWEGHRVGREKAYCHMEKLCNLDQLPVTGYQVICLPVKIKAASAGWCRAVAIME